MTVTIEPGVNIVRLVFGTALWCTLAGCTGSLVYRPEKKPTPDIAAVTVTNSTTPSLHLPQVPDKKANNATLAGIDTTGTGIRDDVYIWIFTNYTSTKTRTPLTKLAKSLQTVVVTPKKTTEDARILKQSLEDALLLLKGVPGLERSKADKMDWFVYEKTVNTPERLKSYLQYNVLQGGGK
jgi:hypothetical protein